MTTSIELPSASRQSGDHPRPQLIRPGWADLGGRWQFAVADASLRPDAVDFDRTILVPFPPESPFAGVEGYCDSSCVWYRRVFGAEQLDAAGRSADRSRVILHFGAVDHAATVWVNGALVARHTGGQTPFSIDITEEVRPAGENELIVRAVDPIEDTSILRGKQDWRERPHQIWYERTTGIWQPVWLECVPDVGVEHVTWRVDDAAMRATARVELRAAPDPGTRVRVVLLHEGQVLADTAALALDRTVEVCLEIPRQRNGQQREELLWSPSNPVLLDARITLEEGERTRDAVSSYLGLRTVRASPDALLLNDRPVRVRAVLAQNYWPETHLAATGEMLRREVDLILELGFNTARIHQKAEDPRFLYWADRRGLMLWGETASAYTFDHRSIAGLISEWTDIVRRDQSHPSIVVWVPLNESWGVQDIEHDPRQQAFSRSVADLTRALDGSRPVIANDGWEHTESDIVTVHDYSGGADHLRRQYGTREAVDAMVRGRGPAGRLIVLGEPDPSRPRMLSEFGGISMTHGNPDSWGYMTAPNRVAFEEAVTSAIAAASTAAGISGFCYTQLTDTGLETNGLLNADRTPKIPVERIRAAVLADERGPSRAV